MPGSSALQKTTPIRTNGSVFAPIDNGYAPPRRRPIAAALTMIADASQAGHGWTNTSSTGTANLNDTTDFARGSQAITLTTTGTNNGTTRADKTGLSVDMTGKDLVVWLKVVGLTNLRQVSLYVGDNNFTDFIRYDLEVTAAAPGTFVREGVWIRYTLPWTPGRQFTDAVTTSASTTITSNTAQFAAADVGRAISGAGIPAGATIASVTNATTAVLSAAATVTATNVTVQVGNSYVGSPIHQGNTVGLRSAITQVRVAINDNGTGPVTVRLSGVAAQSEPTAKFPKGVVSFVFDDGFATQLAAAAYMDKYGYAGTAIPIVNLVGVGGYMTLAQLQQLRDLSGWEIGGHAYSASVHNQGYPAQPDGGLADMRANKAWLAANGFGMDTFAFPQGFHDDASLAAARRVYNCARTTIENGPKETYPPADYYRLRTIMLDNGRTLAQVKAELDQALLSGAWVIITGHKFGASQDSLTWVTSDFQALVDYIATKGIPVRTVGDVLGGV